MSLVLSFLNRKEKFLLGHVSRDFYDLIVPRAVVSMRITGNESVEQGHFKKCMSRFMKVSKLTFEDLVLDIALIQNLTDEMHKNSSFTRRVEEFEVRNL